MVLLRRLCNEGKINLIIPEIVLREFTTQEQERAAIAGKNVLKELKIYSKTLYGTGKNELTDIIKDIENSLIEANKKLQTKIDEFIKETNAKILTPTFDEYKETFDRYFNGEKPYRAIKERKDIPDALAFVQIKNIKDDELAFISEDERLREKVKGGGITVFSTLSDFIETDKIKKIIELKKVDDMLYYLLPQVIEKENLLLLFHTALEQSLLFTKITDEKIPDDNNEGTITGIMGIYPTEFAKEEIAKHGSGLFTIPFYCEIDALLNYFFYKADFYGFDEDRIGEITIEDWNDHYFEAEEEYPLICTGKLGLQFNSKLTSEEITNTSLEILSQEVKISFSDIYIKVKEY
jgi:hypothetical protein